MKKNLNKVSDKLIVNAKPTKKVWDRKLHRTTITLRDKGKTYNVQKSNGLYYIRDLNGLNLELTRENLEAILDLEG